MNYNYNMEYNNNLSNKSNQEIIDRMNILESKMDLILSSINTLIKFNHKLDEKLLTFINTTKDENKQIVHNIIEQEKDKVIEKEIELEIELEKPLNKKDHLLKYRKLSENTQPKKKPTTVSNKNTIVNTSTYPNVNSTTNSNINSIINTNISSNISSNTNNYREIKKENYNIDIKIIKECLNSSSIESDIRLFKKIYIDNVSKEFIPIRSIRKKFQYWCDGHMNEDINGNYIKNTIVDNIENCYLSVNKIENYKDNTEQFFRNQEYITKLSEMKYRDKFLELIIDIIKI